MGILAIEDAVITQLKAVLTNKVRMVESLPGDWDDDMLKRLLRDVPGVYVAFAGGGFKAPGGTTLDAQWIVYVVTGHASGEAARRRGDAQQAGAYELVHVIVPALNGFKVPNEGSFAAVRIENLYTGSIDRQGVAVYAVTFQMLMGMPTEVDESTLTPFVTFDAKYDIPPLTTDAEHRQWLQNPPLYDDTRPDAQDTVSVPQ